MVSELSKLPLLMQEMQNNFGDTLRVFKVSELEKSKLIFVQDGNHGEYRPLQDEFVECGVPFVRPPNLIDGRINFENCQKINEVAFSRVRKGIGKGGDVILTHNATIGRVAITKDTDPIFVTNPQTTVWRSLDRNFLDNNYLYFFMKSTGFQEQLLSHTGRNATFDYVSLTKQRSLDIPILPISIQKTIGKTLRVIDDKIELNCQMNETLEAMAQALFKSWFVDFDPVIDNALAAGNAIPDELFERAELRKGVEKKENSDIQNLFPDEFEFTEEMGWIPKGWVVSNVGTEFNTVGGGTPSTKNPNFWENGNISWTTPKDLSGNQSKVLLHTDRKITELGLNKISSGLLPIDTVLMSSRAPVGYLALAKVPVAINQGYIALKCEKTLTPEFAIQWADSAMDEIKQRAGGTTFAEISKTNFRGIPVLVPSQKIIDTYSRDVKDLYNQITSRIENINTLANLRDTLLPKLMSGELRITDAAALVNKAI